MKLVATKSMTYNTRRLLPGDLFEASPRDARLLKGIRKAKDAEPEKDSAPKRAAPAPSDEPTLDDLRAQAEALGIEADRRWGAKRLKDEIARVQSSEA